MGLVKNIIYGLSGDFLMPIFRRQSVFPYHHLVRNAKVAHIENLYAYKNEEQFRNDLDFLCQNYKPVSPTELLENPNSDKVFLLTFDDGLEEIYSVVFPILEAKNIKAAFFINPDFVDNKQSLYKHDISFIISHLRQRGFEKALLDKASEILGFSYSSPADFVAEIKGVKFSERHKIKAVSEVLGINMQHYLDTQKPYVSKAQIAEMIAAGHWFGGHTMSHPPLAQLTHDEQKAEIIDSIEWVKQNFGIAYSLFAFPFTDKPVTKRLIDELFKYDEKLLLFGNSGLKKDIDHRIIQRFSIENPEKKISRIVVSENLYKLYNKLIGKYHIRRK